MMSLCRRNGALSPVKGKVNGPPIQRAERRDDLIQIGSQVGWQWTDLAGFGIKPGAFTHHHGFRLAIPANDGKHHGIFKHGTLAGGVNIEQRAANASYAIGNFNKVLGRAGKFFDAAVDARPGANPVPCR